MPSTMYVSLQNDKVKMGHNSHKNNPIFLKTLSGDLLPNPSKLIKFQVSSSNSYQDILLKKPKCDKWMN